MDGLCLPGSVQSTDCAHTNLSSGCFSDPNYLIATEITLAGQCRSDAVCFIGLWVDPLSNGTRVPRRRAYHSHVSGITVSLAVHGHCPDA